MDICLRGQGDRGLTDRELRDALTGFLDKHPARKVLFVAPDYTRYHSNAGFLTNVCWHWCMAHGVQADILQALGTHVPMTREQVAQMYGDIPFEAFIPHAWRTDVERLGQVPGDFLSAVTEGLWTESMDVEVNRRVMDPAYDLILSIGQVVPHEVIGMSNQAKNLFVGAGGADMINKSHMMGAIYGIERMMGKDHSPVRKAFDYALERYLGKRPITFLLTVTTAPGGVIRTHGLFGGSGRDALEAAVALSQEKNIDFVEQGIQKCVVYLDPMEFQSTWLGNKAIYRTRMAIADGGELIVLAPGIRRFGEDEQVDGLIRKYGYCGRTRILELLSREECGDLRANMSAAAHLIHGSSDGRFRIVYAVEQISRAEIEGVCFHAASYRETASRYDPQQLQYGYNRMPDGEQVYFIPNPALGLWINREAFDR